MANTAALPGSSPVGSDSVGSANKASLTAWIAVLAGMIGAFMAILNIQITNAFLLDIEGGIGTGVDNGSWISTSYLIGEIVVIPLTDYLSKVFSFRGVLANVLVGFALFGTVYILPQYLGQVQRYNAEQIGNVLAWTGLPQLLLIPFVPLLMKRFGPGYVGFVGISMAIEPFDRNGEGAGLDGEGANRAIIYVTGCSPSSHTVQKIGYHFLLSPY